MAGDAGAPVESLRRLVPTDARRRTRQGMPGCAVLLTRWWGTEFDADEETMARETKIARETMAWEMITREMMAQDSKIAGDSKRSPRGGT